MAKKVLYVDDSKLLREFMRMKLQSAGYEVLVAEDGVAGLEALVTFMPDLVISDWNMPNLNGIDFIKKIRSEPEYAAYRFVPIIMHTTETDEGKMGESRTQGVKMWLTKPIKLEKVLAAIEKIIGPP